MSTKPIINQKYLREIKQYWDDVLHDGEITAEELKSTFRKWTAGQKIHKKKTLKRLHRGTNFKTKKPKKGYQRILSSNGTTYVYKRMTATQKISKKRTGKRLGAQKHRFS